MTSAPLRIVFAGTPDFAAHHLAALLSPALATEFSVVGVFTQPDRRAGRGKKLTPGPVKSLAQDHAIPVFQPPSFKDPAALTSLQALQPDVMIVVAYGLLLPQQVLTLPRYGCINVHASLLPRWRGAAPIERAIMEGDSETGVSIMQMERGLDTGPVLATRHTPIHAEDNALTLTQRLCALGCEALIDTLQALPDGSVSACPQDEALSTYAAKLSRQDAAINWHRPATEIMRQIQAFYPRSPAYSCMGAERLMLLEAHTDSATTSPGTLPGTILSADKTGLLVACGEGCLLVRRVQVAGKKPMSVNDLLNGRREHYSPGRCFTPEAV